MNKPPISTRKEELQRKIAELKGSWPAHSIPPAMLQQLEDLEDELMLLQKNAATIHSDNQEES